LLIVIALAIYLYASALKPASPVGFQQAVAHDPGHSPIAVAIWYPTSARPGFVLLGSTGERVASGGPVAGNGLPLVVISHGTGGAAMSHADTAIALAEKGFVVAALTHPGDNFQDDRDVGGPDWLLNRSRHLRMVVDMMVRDWKDRGHIDPRRIGLFGFSAGATSALIDIGGVPDLRRVSSHCSKHPEFVCQLMTPQGDRGAKPPAWEADGRIRAAVLAAPGLGFTFEPDGLSKVRVPVQLWAGVEDRTVPFATNGGVVQRLLPRPADLHLVPGASHYSFLMPCGLIGPPQLCKDAKGFDRADFHRRFNASVVSFFQEHLGP
jgi:predicted dienelactone hydrolase